MGKNSFKLKCFFLFAVFLTGQFFLNASACAEWTVVGSPPVSSDWELFNIRFGWAVGQDSENQTGVLLYLLNGSWIPATLPDVSSDWALFGVDLTSSSKGWAVGQDFENKKGVLIYFRNPEIPELATVTTTPVSNITDTTATGGGNITSDGGTAVTARGVCWSTSVNPVVGGTCTSDGTGPGVFTSSITGLEPDTLYHVRAYGTNSAGTAYGNELIFTTTTSSSLLPTVTTTPVSEITDTTATGGGNVTSAGNTAVTARGVCWSTSGNPVVGGTCTSDGTGTGVFTSSITGLTSSTLYHVRAYATNSTGTAYGDDLTFSTTASALTLPIPAGRPASNVSSIASDGNLIWPSVSVTPPNVSADWGLSALHFFSSDKGWAVGDDFENGKGVILYFSGDAWISIRLPNVSSDWGLSSVHFSWAVGQDRENSRGVILHFSGGSWTSIIPPDVSSNWGLSAVQFLSSHEAWAVGQDFENGRGVLLHFLNGSWTSEPLPDVSSNWGLSSVDFTSSQEGWAVGEDFENTRGVLLYFFDGLWVSVSPPDVSSSWGLSGVHLISPISGWAVGHTSDGSNLNGLLLRYTLPKISVSPTSVNFNDVEIGAFLEKTVTVKNTGNGDLVIGTITASASPFSIITDSCSGRSLSRSQSCKIIFRFLPVTAETFSANANISSNASNQDPVTVTLTGNGKGETLNDINLLSPLDGQTFTACDYLNPSLFQWESSGIFSSIEVQFSLENDFSRVPLKLKGDVNGNQLIIRSKVWKKVLLLPGGNGGTLYWKVLARKKDKTRVESDIFSFVVDPPGPVVDSEISHTSRSTSPPPTLSWDNNCNVIFTVWFGNDSDFRNPYMKRIPISLKIRNPDEIQEPFAKELTSSQWNSIRKLGGDVTGATLYWYVESRDTLGRRQKTDVMSFVLTD